MRWRGFFRYLFPGAGESSEIREDGRQDVVGPDQNDDSIRRYAQYGIEPLGDVDRQIAAYAEVDESDRLFCGRFASSSIHLKVPLAAVVLEPRQAMVSGADTVNSASDGPQWYSLSNDRYLLNKSEVSLAMELIVETSFDITLGVLR
jgi:hypothetical protein